MKASRPGIVLSALPNFLMVVLFYSLAIHMRQSLGAWPTSIGERGFPPPLATHAAITGVLFVILLLSSLFVAPGAIAACLLVRRWRPFVPYFALFALLFFIGWGLMQMAPAPFLIWWRD